MAASRHMTIIRFESFSDGDMAVSYETGNLLTINYEMFGIHRRFYLKIEKKFVEVPNCRKLN